MSIPADPLFKPFSVKNLKLANRVVMAPMTRSFSPGGVPGADVAAYYRRRAENQVGLIITEGTVIDHPASTNDPRVPHIYGEAALAGWAQVVAEVHAAGGRIMPQIWHVGTVQKNGRPAESGSAADRAVRPVQARGQGGRADERSRDRSGDRGLRRRPRPPPSASASTASSCTARTAT